jgi:hypothetical protein
MPIRPRHYILLAVVLGIFVFNILRHRHDAQNAITPPPAPVVTTATKLQTPAWAAFDHAAGLRDAPPDQFAPALADVQKLLPLDPNPNDGHLSDIKGCLTWLEFYRQGMAQSGIQHHADPQMKSSSLRHINGCTQFHLDTSA